VARRRVRLPPGGRARHTVALGKEPTMGKHEAQEPAHDGHRVGAGQRGRPPVMGQPTDTGRHSDTNPNRQGGTK